MKNVITKFLVIIVIVMFIFTCMTVNSGIRYDPEFGFYDTRVYSFTVGELLLYGDDAINYAHTHLNFMEIMERVFI